MALARARDPHAAQPAVTLDDAEAALGTKLHRYGRDEHYDVISAFIKSIRGPTPRPPCTTWPTCSRPARTPASSPAAWSSWPARTSARPTRWAWWWRRPPPTPSSTWACPRPSSTWPRPWCTWQPHPSRTGPRSASGRARARAQRGGRRGAGAPAGRALPLGPLARARGRLRVSSRRSAGLGTPSSTSPTMRRATLYYRPSRHGYEQEIADRMDRLSEGSHDERAAGRSGAGSDGVRQ